MNGLQKIAVLFVVLYKVPWLVFLKSIKFPINKKQNEGFDWNQNYINFFIELDDSSANKLTKNKGLFNESHLTPSSLLNHNNKV